MLFHGFNAVLNVVLSLVKYTMQNTLHYCILGTPSQCLSSLTGHLCITAALVIPLPSPIPH
jgi:hypothetical protein